MTNTTLIGMTSLVLVAIGTLLAINFFPKASLEVTEQGLPPLEVRGAAVVYKGVPFTLNFEQQQLATNAILRAEKVEKSKYPEIKRPLNFEKMILYRFNASDLEIFPIQYDETNLVFSAPDLNKDYYFIELSGGALKNMIDSSYDK